MEEHMTYWMEKCNCTNMVHARKQNICHDSGDEEDMTKDG